MNNRSLKFIIPCLLSVFLRPGIADAAGSIQGGFAPKLFQVTTAETRPNDAVLIRGEYIDRIEEIKVFHLDNEAVARQMPGYIAMPVEDMLPDSRGTDLRVKARTAGTGQSVEMIQQTSQSVKFIVPKSMQQGVFCVQMTDTNGQTDHFYLNIPRVNWIISEQGQKVTAGDYLRIQGKNLQREGGNAQIALIPTNGRKAVWAGVTKFFDDYSVSVDIPDATVPGEYHLYYHNGLGGKTAWSEPLRVTVIVKPAPCWGTKVYNVLDFGAKGEGTVDETDAFRAALDAAEQNGGGTVYVPRGRYMLTGELIIAPNTLLKGESKELTQLFWNPLNWETKKLPNSLISGTHHFGITDLNLWASRAWGMIFSTGPVEEQGNILLENLIFKQNYQLSGMVYQVKSNRDVLEDELMSRWTKSGIILRGENIKVRNCQFNSCGMYTFFAASGFIQNCRFERVSTGINQPYMLVHPKGLIFEDCYKQGDGYGYAASIDESRDLYEARNVIPFDYVNDRECMTLDGGSGAYHGPIGRIDGQTLHLPFDAVTNQWAENKWKGGGVYILEGKGAGQFRRIKSHTLTAVELDQPFLVQPDASSVISITTVRHHFYFINNQATDAGSYQLYGSIQNSVISGMTLTRCNGIISRGSLIYNGKQPEWYIDIVNCRLKEGNYIHWFGIDDRGHSGYQNINLIGSGGTGLSIGMLIRRNNMSEFSYIRTSPGANPNAINDVIIEDNRFHIAKIAILLGGSGSNTSNVLIHNNHYSKVDKRLDTKVNSDCYRVLEDGQ